MPSEFRQTSIALRSDHERGRRSLILLAVMGMLLVLVGTWMAAARVPLYAVSEVARLQARDEVHPIDALVAGRVVAVNLPVGGSVRRGDVVVTLDASDVQLRLDEARATERGLSAQITALEHEIAAREDALASTASLGKASLSEAQAARSQIEVEAGLASRERERADAARRAGVVAEAEADRANAAKLGAEAQVHAREQRLGVLTSETRRDLADRRAQNDSLTRSLAAISAERDRAGVAVRRLEVERDRHTLRAPIDGVLGQVRAPQVGSVVAAGQTVAVVTPDADLQLVADFAPASAVGRIRVGQRAHMRVTGFPWTRYGMLGAVVAAVSSEAEGGRIRVVLRIDPSEGFAPRSAGNAVGGPTPCDRASPIDDAGAPAIPRCHGLIGEVEVELDQVSPAVLIARAAGQLFEREDRR